MEKLFVYGTLQPDQPNEHVLNKIGGTWTKASVKGKLLEIGWGANMGFPGLVLDERCDDVPGSIFTSDHLHEHWADLDAFEGDEYKRIKTRVLTETGAQEEVYLYVLNLSDKD